MKTLPTITNNDQFQQYYRNALNQKSAWDDITNALISRGPFLDPNASVANYLKGDIPQIEDWLDPSKKVSDFIQEYTPGSGGPRYDTGFENGDWSNYEAPGAILKPYFDTRTDGSSPYTLSELQSMAESLMEQGVVDRPRSSGGFFNKIAPALTGGVINRSGQVNTKQLLENSLSPATLGLSDVAAGVTGGGTWGQKLDRSLDPGGNIDIALRQHGKEMGPEVTNVAAPVVQGIGSAIGPGFAAGAAGVANKLQGGDYNTGFKNAGIAAATRYAGGAASGLGNAASGAVGGGTTGSIVGGATTGAATNAARAALSGQSVGDAALAGAITGGVGGAMTPVANNLSSNGVNSDVANVAANTLGGGAKSALTGGSFTGGATNALINSATNQITGGNPYANQVVNSLVRSYTQQGQGQRQRLTPEQINMLQRLQQRRGHTTPNPRASQLYNRMTGNRGINALNGSQFTIDPTGYRGTGLGK